MYNLLLILFMLKGEHVDRDLTYEGLVGFDVMNTKLRDFWSGELATGWRVVLVSILFKLYFFVIEIKFQPITHKSEYN